MEGAVGRAERRQSPRLCPGGSALAVPAARLRTGDRLVVLNIGPGGALVESRTRMLPGAAVDIQLWGAGGSTSVRALVVRCSVSVLDRDRGLRYRAAVAFGRPVTLDHCSSGVTLAHGARREAREDREAREAECG